MPKRDRWRNALTISVLVHCLLMTGIGWLGGNLTRAAKIPDMIEVELITDPGRNARKDNLSTAVPSSVARTSENAQAAADKSAVVAEMTADTVAENYLPQTAVNTGRSETVVVGASTQVSGNGPAAPKRLAPPRILAKTEPLYPEEARQAGIEGMVAVRIEIKENGQPGEVAVARSSGRASFDAAAVQAIRSWQFVPAQEMESGRAVRCYTTILVVFKLKS
jgi:protein TonB